MALAGLGRRPAHRAEGNARTPSGSGSAACLRPATSDSRALHTGGSLARSAHKTRRGVPRSRRMGSWWPRWRRVGGTVDATPWCPGTAQGSVQPLPLAQGGAAQGTPRIEREPRHRTSPTPQVDETADRDATCHPSLETHPGEGTAVGYRSPAAASRCSRRRTATPAMRPRTPWRRSAPTRAPGRMPSSKRPARASPGRR